jgi:hypothetical protein
MFAARFRLRKGVSRAPASDVGDAAGGKREQLCHEQDTAADRWIGVLVACRLHGLTDAVAVIPLQSGWSGPENARSAAESLTADAA